MSNRQRPVDLTKKVVIITGASQGIGRQTALLFAEKGASVILAARRRKLLSEVIDSLNGSTRRHLSVSTDISRDEDVKRLISEAMNRYGRIDILVNNAAVSYVGRVKDLDMRKAEDTININLLGTIRVTTHTLPHMIKQQSGHIINVSSIIGRKGIPYRSIYCASKFGIEGFMESLRSEVAKYNIKVSIIRPPTVNTDFSTKIKRDSDVNHHALSNMDPNAVARVIVDIAKRPRREVNMGILAKGFLFLGRLSPVLVDKIVNEK